MKNRDKYIAIVFLVFILTIPLVTVVRGFLPEREVSSEVEQEILKGNGTLQEEADNTAVEAAEESQEVSERDYSFQALQNTLNEFTNRLFLRTKMIAFNTNLASWLTGGTYIESTQVMAGKDGWLFYKSELDGHPLWDFMGINHFTEDELAAIAANLVQTRDYYAERGIDFFVTCIPNKEIIYEEYMPDTTVRVDTVSRAEQLSTYIKENTDLIYAFPKEALLDAKKQGLVYYKTDTHWNQVGAFVGVQEIFKEAYGNSDSLDKVSFDFTPESYPGDLAYIAGISDKYPMNDVYSFDTDSADKALYHDQVAVVVGDSFGGFLSTVSKGYYKEVYWIKTDAFTMEELESYAPDVVIWEAVERYCDVFAKPTLRQ